MKTTVDDIMTEDVITLTRDNTLADARKLMTENRIRHIPIVDDNGNLQGLISQRDVLAAEESSIASMTTEERRQRELEVKIGQFYRENVSTVSPKASVLKAALYMQKYKIGCLPVVEDDKLVGMVTDSDFINVAINLLELQEQARY